MEISQDHFTFDLSVEEPQNSFYFTETNRRYHLMTPNVFYKEVIVGYRSITPATPEDWVAIHDRFTLKTVESYSGLDFDSPVEGVLPKLERDNLEIKDLNERTYEVDKTGAQLAAAVVYYDAVSRKLQGEGKREKAESFQKVLGPLHHAAMAYSTDVARCLN